MINWIDIVILVILAITGFGLDREFKLTRKALDDLETKIEDQGKKIERLR